MLAIIWFAAAQTPRRRRARRSVFTMLPTSLPALLKTVQTGEAPDVFQAGRDLPTQGGGGSGITSKFDQIEEFD
jgi:hypothetical protein